MSTRPGMADGRSMGLQPYMQSGDYNMQMMNQLGARSNAEYRALIHLKGADIVHSFHEAAAANVDPVGQGCGGSPQEIAVDVIPFDPQMAYGK